MKMVEGAKTVLLVALVALSLVLTGRLMIGEHGALQDSGQPFILRDTEAPEIDVQAALKPSRIVVHLGKDQHTVLLPGSPDYVAIWDTGLVKRAYLNEVNGASRQAPVDMKALRAEQGSLELIYPVKVPFSQLVYLWTGFTWSEGDDFLSDRVAVSTGKNPAVYAYSYTHERYLRFDVRSAGKDVELLTALLKDIIYGNRPKWIEAPAEVNGVAINRGVLLPRTTSSIAPLVVKGEQVNPDEVLKQFFLDRSIVRRIEEKDGAVIFTDGRQGLRIYPPGAIEYSCPLVAGDGRSADYLSLLERALEFTASHGGLPEGVHPIELSGQSRPGDLREVRLSYRWKGIPVWGREAPIVVGLSPEGVGSYLRGVSVVTGPANPGRRPMPAEEALNILSRHWATAFPEGIEKVVKDIHLGYWSQPVGEKQDLLKPVWVIEATSGLKAFVDVVSGAVWGEGRTGR